MYILHIETSTKICSVALSQHEDLIDCLERTEGMNHTALLAPMISQLLKSAFIKPDDLGAISVSSGPGSYTGLRVGSSTAKAMAYSLNIPLLSIPTLSALARASFDKYPEADLALPMMDARRNEVYTALYDSAFLELFPTCSLILDRDALDFVPDGKMVICSGDGAFKLEGMQKACGHIIIDLVIQTSAKHLIKPALILLGRKDHSDPMHFVPYYLKPPNITQRRKGQ